VEFYRSTRAAAVALAGGVTPCERCVAQEDSSMELALDQLLALDSQARLALGEIGIGRDRCSIVTEQV
jgi:hypothetical protein